MSSFTIADFADQVGPSRATEWFDNILSSMTTMQPTPRSIEQHNVSLNSSSVPDTQPLSAIHISSVSDDEREMSLSKRCSRRSVEIEGPPPGLSTISNQSVVLPIDDLSQNPSEISIQSCIPVSTTNDTTLNTLLVDSIRHKTNDHSIGNSDVHNNDKTLLTPVHYETNQSAEIDSTLIHSVLTNLSHLDISSTANDHCTDIHTALFSSNHTSNSTLPHADTQNHSELDHFPTTTTAQQQSSFAAHNSSFYNVVSSDKLTHTEIVQQVDNIDDQYHHTTAEIGLLPCKDLSPSVMEERRPSQNVSIIDNNDFNHFLKNSIASPVLHKSHPVDTVVSESTILDWTELLKKQLYSNDNTFIHHDIDNFDTLTPEGLTTNISPQPLDTSTRQLDHSSQPDITQHSFQHNETLFSTTKPTHYFAEELHSELQHDLSYYPYHHYSALKPFYANMVTDHMSTSIDDTTYNQRHLYSQGLSSSDLFINNNDASLYDTKLFQSSFTQPTLDKEHVTDTMLLNDHLSTTHPLPIMSNYLSKQSPINDYSQRYHTQIEDQILQTNDHSHHSYMLQQQFIDHLSSNAFNHHVLKRNQSPPLKQLLLSSDQHTPSPVESIHYPRHHQSQQDTHYKDYCHSTTDSTRSSQLPSTTMIPTQASSPQRSHTGAAQLTLIVNVPPTTTRQDLLNAFRVFGQVLMPTVVCRKETRQPKKEWTATAGYAFVLFGNKSAARAALAATESGHVIIRGSSVKATWAKKDSFRTKTGQHHRMSIDTPTEDNGSFIQPTHGSHHKTHNKKLSQGLSSHPSLISDNDLYQSQQQNKQHLFNDLRFTTDCLQLNKQWISSEQPQQQQQQQQNHMSAEGQSPILRDIYNTNSVKKECIFHKQLNCFQGQQCLESQHDIFKQHTQDSNILLPSSFTQQDSVLNTTSSTPLSSSFLSDSKGYLQQLKQHSLSHTTNQTRLPSTTNSFLNQKNCNFPEVSSVLPDITHDNNVLQLKPLLHPSIPKASPHLFGFTNASYSVNNNNIQLHSAGLQPSNDYRLSHSCLNDYPLISQKGEGSTISANELFEIPPQGHTASTRFLHPL